VDNTLVVKHQIERESVNHQVTTPSVKSDCIETNAPFDLNSVLPVAIDHPGPSIRTSNTALPSDKFFEPTLEKVPTTHAIQVGDGDRENGFVTAASVTKEPALAVEIVMDSDCLETYEYEDLTTVVLADKGKGVDPREYSGALHNLNSILVPAGSTSTGASDSIELVDVHQDKGKNVNPEGGGIGMAKDKPGPSRIDFHDHGAVSFQEQGIPLQSFEPTQTKDPDDGPTYDLTTLPQLSWHPKISPYRFIVFSIPLAIGTFKAILSQKGSVTTPITLEWISGVVIFLV
jgi:hypothetical protein